MVKASKFRHGRGSAGLQKQPSPSHAVVRAAGHRSPDCEARICGGETLFHSSVACHHPRHAVRATLLPLGHIVEERRDDEVSCGFAAFQQPARGGGAVDDVSWMLTAKEREKRTIEVTGGEFEIGASGQSRCLAELAQPLGH